MGHPGPFLPILVSEAEWWSHTSSCVAMMPPAERLLSGVGGQGPSSCSPVGTQGAGFSAHPREPAPDSVRALKVRAEEGVVSHLCHGFEGLSLPADLG